MQIIGYRLDLKRPYRIIDQDDTHVVVEGCSKTMQMRTPGGAEGDYAEYGGIPGFWRIPKEKLLNKAQKRRLKYIHRIYGYVAASHYYRDTCAQVIAEHSNNSYDG